MTTISANTKLADPGERTEEVQDIIDRMPGGFGIRISLIVLLLLLLLFYFGWTVRYPDVVTGQAILNTRVAPLRLVSNTAGKLILTGIHSQSKIKEGEVIAYIEDAVSFPLLERLNTDLRKFNPYDANSRAIINSFPSKIALGSLTPKYYDFLSNLRQYANFKDDRLYEKQIEGLNKLLSVQQDLMMNNEKRLEFGVRSLDYNTKFYSRDSLLFAGKVISESDLDQRQLNLLNSKDNLKGLYTLQLNMMKDWQQTQVQIKQTEIQMTEKGKELELSLVTAYTNLVSSINGWEQNYVFRAPFDGQVQFQNFWTSGQFIPSGQSVFTVIPNDEDPYVQVILPALGVGKVHIGQEVIVKLDNFPYTEYGTIRGTISDISLTTHTEKTPQGEIEAYLVTVKCPHGLVTNYGKKLNFKQESRGTAEIITNNRKFIQRLFDNLRYTVKK